MYPVEMVFKTNRNWSSNSSVLGKGGGDVSIRFILSLSLSLSLMQSQYFEVTSFKCDHWLSSMIYHSEWEYYDDDTQFLSSDTIFVISKDIHGYVLIKKKSIFSGNKQ